ncbi:MAG TPA: c-type cytochrome biogenesis protein CcmI [Afifellaceae bacterium]|nr:c-type cytochrome biogenesis protein CcmI [Afifellaceae bacterium]
MLFWFLIAALTAAAMLAVLLPLSGGRDTGNAVPGPAVATDMDVYRRQLGELADDEAQARIGPAEAEVTRAEIARRLIAAQRSADISPAATGDSRLRRRLAAIFGLVAVPAFALSLYLVTGAPDLPGQPLAARIAAASEGDSIDELVAKVEAYLASNPEDGRAWELLAPVYVRLGRPSEAVAALRNAIRILGSTADRQADLGEAIIMTQGGIVTADARKAFQASVELEPGAPKPLFFLALAKKQDGDAAGAAADWRALLADAPPDAPYRRSIELALADDGSQPGGPPAPPEPQSGPTAEDMANAQSLSPGERQAMIDSMVSRLADRLASEPDDAEGWLRLVRAYAVLGRQAEAEKAATTGMKSVSESADRARIARLAAELGIALEDR